MTKNTPQSPHRLSSRRWLIGSALLAAIAVASLPLIKMGDDGAQINDQSMSPQALANLKQEVAAYNEGLRPVQVKLAVDTKHAQTQRYKNRLDNELEDRLLRALYGIDDGADYRTIARASDALFDRASDDDIQALIEYLDAPLIANLNQEEWRAIKRHIVDFIAMEWQDRAQAESVLLEILQRKDVNAHLKADILNRMDRLYPDSDNPAILEEVLWDITAQPESPLASGSLTALTRINFNESAIDEHRLLTVAERLAFETQSAPLTKITAIQVASHLDSPSVAINALAVAENRANPQMVRIAALTAATSLKDRSVVQRLEKISAHSQDPLISKAAELAIDRISTNLALEN